MSPALALMLRPGRTYRRLADDCPAITPWRALRRPALAALVLGTAISIAGTGRATAPLVLSTTMCWSFATAWQLLAAVVLARVPTVRLTVSQRLDLFYVGHAPWSLWLLTTAAWSRLFPNQTDLYAVLCTVAIPAAWTGVIVYGFCTGALNLPRSSALRRTLVHQAIIWGFAFVYVAWAVALWPRTVAGAL